MKLLCIMCDSFNPPKLRVGEIYTYTGEWQCTCGKVWYTVAEIEPHVHRVGGKCPACEALVTFESNHYHFYSTRFTPYRLSSDCAHTLVYAAACLGQTR